MQVLKFIWMYSVCNMTYELVGLWVLSLKKVTVYPESSDNIEYFENIVLKFREDYH